MGAPAIKPSFPLGSTRLWDPSGGDGVDNVKLQKLPPGISLPQFLLKTRSPSTLEFSSWLAQPKRRFQQLGACQYWASLDRLLFDSPRGITKTGDQDLMRHTSRKEKLMPTMGFKNFLFPSCLPSEVTGTCISLPRSAWKVKTNFQGLAEKLPTSDNI